MLRRLTIVAFTSLVMASSVFANAGPAPLPKDRKVVDAPVRFDGIDQHGAYVFHVYYHAYYLGGGKVEVKDANVIKLDFKRKDSTPVLSYMALLALDRKEFDKRKKEDPSLKWLNAQAEGVLSAKLDPPPTTVPITLKEIPVTIYRVTLKDGKLSADKQDAKKSAAEPTGSLPPWPFGVALSLSIVWFGLWFARRG